MEWRFPINFWGKVVDENDRPIEGALVDFYWNDLSRAGTSRVKALSDANGFFSLLD